MFKPVIMAGGVGSRLWPLSRGNFPKQFLSLTAEHTMLQQTLLRLNGIASTAPILLCNEQHRFIAAEQLRQLNVQGADIILEPAGRNTAPAIALAAMRARQQISDDTVLLVLAADHVIADTGAFHQAIEQALPLAKAGKLVTFGIVPDHAETGYGYIKRGDALSGAYQVAAFVEKPDLQTAEYYVQSEQYYWNSGMFMFTAGGYLQELKRLRPDIYAACDSAMALTATDLEFVRVDKAAFEACPAESVDYAVMEHTELAVVVPLSAGWNDVGGFASLWQICAKDTQGNVIDGDAMCIDTENCYLRSDDKLLATIGIRDLIVVNTKDAVLIADRAQAQQVKQIVSQLQSAGRIEGEFHREVYRPWGKYDSVDHGERFQVKRITVKPGAKLSVQMHHHRAEHWIVVSGTARVTIDDKQQYLTENQSIYIPITAVHALENPGKVPLELIEVQSGAYLGEDDIVRFEDRYGRA